MENQGVLTTYKAILRGNSLEWRSDVGARIAADRAIAVYVTVLDESVTAPPEVENQGQRMAAALEQLARLRAGAAILDPAAWERERRQDRSLPGREA
jgi:hypothetical protein